MNAIKDYKLPELCFRNDLRLDWDIDDNLSHAIITRFRDDAQLCITFDEKDEIIAIASRQPDDFWEELTKNKDGYIKYIELILNDLHSHNIVSSKYMDTRLMDTAIALKCDWLDYMFCNPKFKRGN